MARAAPPIARAGRRWAAAALLAAAGCAAPNLSRTVGRGNWELHVSHGGPLLRPPGWPPVPFGHTHIGGRYGLSDRVDIDGNLNLLPLGVGLLQVDTAVVLQIFRRPRRLAVSAAARLAGIFDLDDPPAARLFTEWGLHVGRPLGRFVHPYGGLLLTNPLTVRTADLPPSFLTPFAGLEFLLPPRRGRQHGLAVHVAWTNPWVDSDAVVDYAPPMGALAVYLGYQVRFGGLDR